MLDTLCTTFWDEHRRGRHKTHVHTDTLMPSRLVWRIQEHHISCTAQETHRFAFPGDADICSRACAAACHLLFLDIVHCKFHLDSFLRHRMDT